MEKWGRTKKLNTILGSATVNKSAKRIPDHVHNPLGTVHQMVIHTPLTSFNPLSQIKLGQIPDVSTLKPTTSPMLLAS